MLDPRARSLAGFAYFAEISIFATLGPKRDCGAPHQREGERVGEITVHGLRHSAATILLNHLGKDLREIPGTRPPQEYPDHRAVYPCRLRADPADRGGTEWVLE
jgi:integrase